MAAYDHLLESASRLLIESGDALDIEQDTTGSVTGTGGQEQARFGGSPISTREIDRMTWEQQLERLLREDEEILCLV